MDDANDDELELYFLDGTEFGGICATCVLRGIVITPSIVLYMSHYVYPKSSITIFNRLFKKIIIVPQRVVAAAMGHSGSPHVVECHHKTMLSFATRG